MISAKNRFHGLNALRYVYKSGSTTRLGPLTMKAMPSRRSDYRLAVVVSKKVHKSAVKRNRIRRRLYETVRVLKKESGSNWQNDIVITVFDESVAEMPHAELKQSLTKLLQKSSVM